MRHTTADLLRRDGRFAAPGRDGISRRESSPGASRQPRSRCAGAASTNTDSPTAVRFIQVLTETPSMMRLGSVRPSAFLYKSKGSTNPRCTFIGVRYQSPEQSQCQPFRERHHWRPILCLVLNHADLCCGQAGIKNRSRERVDSGRIQKMTNQHPSKPRKISSGR